MGFLNFIVEGRTIAFIHWFKNTSSSSLDLNFGWQLSQWHVGLNMEKSMVEPNTWTKYMSQIHEPNTWTKWTK